MLMAHNWPGNVRELENVIQRMILLGPEALRFNPVETPAPERRVASLDRRRKPRRPADIAAAAAQQPAPPAALEARR